MSKDKTEKKEAQKLSRRQEMQIEMIMHALDNAPIDTKRIREPLKNAIETIMSMELTKLRVIHAMTQQQYQFNFDIRLEEEE